MSLFGGAPASQPSFFSTPSAPQSAPSLFGTSQAATSTPNLFGAAPASSASLFGTPASSASLFGAPASSASLFGAPASSASLFGTPGLGNINTAPNTNINTTGLFSQQQPQLQQQQQQQQQLQQQLHQQQQQHNASQNLDFPGHTKINDLPDNHKADLFAVERHLRDQRAKYNLLCSKRATFDRTVLADVRAASDAVAHSITKARAEIDSLQANAQSLRAAVSIERSSAEPVLVALDNLRRAAPTPSSASFGLGAIPSSVPEDYFERVLQEIEGRAHSYKLEIDEITQFLKSHGILIAGNSSCASNGAGNAAALWSGELHANGGANHAALDSISNRYALLGQRRGNNAPALAPVTSESYGKTIEDIIKRQYEYFMVVAGQTAAVNDNLRSVKEEYLQYLRAKDPDAPNPFEQARK